MYFDELDLNDNILDALYDMRFDECTPVQEKCIPEILAGHDLLGIAQVLFPIAVFESSQQIESIPIVLLPLKNFVLLPLLKMY